MKAEFDHAAKDYDASFSHSCVGRAQRDQVWNYVRKALTVPKQILEINGGTGIDANWLQNQGHEVVYSDISPEMIRETQRKFPALKTLLVDANSLVQTFPASSVLFSDFGGLNCLSPIEMKHFFEQAAQLNYDEHILVVMGKKCLWERLYFRIKGKYPAIRRRNTTEAIQVHVDGNWIETYYYSPDDLIKLAPDYREITRVPIGLAVPPSYMAPFFEHKTVLFGLLKGLDKIFRWSVFANHSDHFLLHLKKQSA